MINTILFAVIIVLTLVFFALLVIIFQEYRAKKLQSHYVMSKNEQADSVSNSPLRDGNDKKTKRCIPSTDSAKESIETTKDTDDKELSGRVSGREEKEAECQPVFKNISQTKRAIVEQKRYDHFDPSRLVKTMGLSQKEADEFVFELIDQLENAIIRLDEKIEEEDFDGMERIIHDLKGAASNIGTGGVADILIEYNNEMKNCRDLEIATAYRDLLKKAIDDLKIEYSQVA